MSKIWLITGSASGLGRTITEAVLAHGDRVIATARNPERLSDLVERYGDSICPLPLDVTDSSAARAAVDAGIAAFGRIDVLVNNAGFGNLAPFEQTEEAAFRTEIDTNFHGVVNVTRAVVPVMRRQRAGTILQISSVGGRISTPGMAAYQAAKWAVGGFSDVLGQELAPLGIRVCVLEPGGMPTNWLQRATRDTPAIEPDYAPTVGALHAMISEYEGKQNGDPAKVAQVIIALADHPKPPMRLLLGSDALHFAAAAEAARAAEGEAWQDISRSIDINAGAPHIPKLPIWSDRSRG